MISRVFVWVLATFSDAGSCLFHRVVDYQANHGQAVWYMSSSVII